MLSRTGGAWERELVPFRIVTVLPDGRSNTAEQPRDAGWLIRRGARAEAIGSGLGQLVKSEANGFSPSAPTDQPSSIARLLRCVGPAIGKDRHNSERDEFTFPSSAGS